MDLNESDLAEIAAEFSKDINEEALESATTSKDESGTSKVGTSTHSVLVNSKQRGNPLLKSVTKVIWEYADIVPDYQMGAQICALFLSLRYHNLNPDYIHERLKLLKDMYRLRILLVQVDVKDPHHALKNLTRICILANMTLMLAWSPEEAGRIIETYKIFENKPPDNVMGKSESSSYIRVVQALASIKPINKTDAMNLLTRFKTLEGLVKATEFQLSECPGLGPRKAKKLYSALRESFCKS